MRLIHPLIYPPAISTLVQSTVDHVKINFPAALCASVSLTCNLPHHCTVTSGCCHNTTSYHLPRRSSSTAPQPVDLSSPSYVNLFVEYASSHDQACSLMSNKPLNSVHFISLHLKLVTSTPLPWPQP